MKKTYFQFNVANVSLYLLFPGFFFYHFAIAKGYIPPILGGYFFVVSVSLCVLLIAAYFKTFKKDIDPVTITFFTVLSLNLIITVTHYIYGTPIGYSLQMLEWSIKGILFNVTCFLIASRLNVNSAASILCIILPIMSLIIFFNVGSQGIFDPRHEAPASTIKFVVSYQGFAGSLVVLLLLTTAVNLNNNLFYFYVLLGMVSLYLSGSRTEFVLFIFSMLSMYLLYTRLTWKYSFKIAGVLLALLSLTFVSIEFLPQSRMLQLVNLLNSSSFEQRHEFFLSSIEQISDSLVFGKYGAYTEIGGLGSYPHNLLSAWLNLGFLGFALYIILLGQLCLKAFHAFDHYRDYPGFKSFLSFLFFLIPALVLSKTYTYMLVGLTVGFYANLKKIDN